MERQTERGGGRDFRRNLLSCLSPRSVVFFFLLSFSFFLFCREQGCAAPSSPSAVLAAGDDGHRGGGGRGGGGAVDGAVRGHRRPPVRHLPALRLQPGQPRHLVQERGGPSLQVRERGDRARDRHISLLGEIRCRREVRAQLLMAPMFLF